MWLQYGNQYVIHGNQKLIAGSQTGSCLALASFFPTASYLFWWQMAMYESTAL